jgi:UDPglucose 6-dehydrogenase
MAKEPIGVIGAGWVGLVTAACFAELGHDVVVRDIVPERIEELERGRVPIHEPGLGELLAANRERLTYTLAIADVFERASLAFVSVPTPPTYSGDADLSAVWHVLDELPELEERVVLVMKSTVPVGTGEKVRARLDARGLAHVGYVSNPEFLAESTAIRDFTEPDRIVIGAFDEADGDRVAALYADIPAPLVRTDVASAEMIKLASNAFLATKISFINEIANVCEQTGADVAAVADGMGLDRRIGPLFLRPGIGYSGSCLPKDATALKQLAGNSGYHFQVLSAVIEVNELQKRRVVQKLAKHLDTLRGKTIALLGLAFKPNTNDMREAPSLILAPRLLAEGAHVRGWDPVALEQARGLLQGVELVPTMLEAVAGADAAVIVTEWEELRGLLTPELRDAMRTPLIVDGRNMLDPETARSAGFAYEGIGRAASPLAALAAAEEPPQPKLRS